MRLCFKLQYMLIVQKNSVLFIILLYSLIIVIHFKYHSQSIKQIKVLVWNFNEEFNESKCFYAHNSRQLNFNILFLYLFFFCLSTNRVTNRGTRIRAHIHIYASHLCTLHNQILITLFFEKPSPSTWNLLETDSIFTSARRRFS